MSTAVSPIAEAKQRLPLPVLMAQLGDAEHAKKSARCPFHQDSNNSFSVWHRADGTWGFKCHAGCGAGDEVDYLALKRGIENAEACREYIRLAGTGPAALPPSVPAAQHAPVAPPFDWEPCVGALTPAKQEELAKERGYSLAFVQWGQDRDLIGWHGGDVALPVHNVDGAVIACHHRVGDKWLYHPSGVDTAPLVIGNIATAKSIYAFESQWDCFAFMDRMNWHINTPTDAACIITRGAGNGKLVHGLCRSDATMHAFVQNDEPNPKTGKRAGDVWLEAVAAHCGCKCLHVATPAPHKDLNDWTRAGARADAIHAAINEAKDVRVLTRKEFKADTEPADLMAYKVVAGLVDDESETESLPDFPVVLLSPIMATFVKAIERCERVPAALPAVCALGALSSAIGPGVEVISGPNRTTPANLFLLASAESGSGKSETFRLVWAQLMEHQKRLVETWRTVTGPRIVEEIETLEAQIKRLTREAARKGATDEDCTRINGEKELKRAKIGQLTRQAAMPCIMAQDATMERLAALLYENRQRLASASADARKLVDNLFGRYNPGRMTDESLYLATYSRDFVRVDRQNRDPVILDKPWLSLLWLIQPDLLMAIMNQEGLSVSGFNARLLVSNTGAQPRKIADGSSTIPEAVRNQWNAQIAELLNSYHSADKPELVKPTDEALAALNDFHDRIVERRSTDLADMGPYAARYGENAWRIALVIHVGLHGSKAHLHPLVLETAENAIGIMQWFIAQQHSILAKTRRAAHAKVEDEVMALIGHFANHPNPKLRRDYVTVRDVHRARIVNTPEGAQALVTRMEAEGLLSCEESTPQHGGRTTRLYRQIGNPIPE
jgi:hypothetical protein